MNDQRREHWEQVYSTKDAQSVSWFRPHLDASLRWLRQAGLDPHSRVIDVGGGASTLVDDLLDGGVGTLTVLDLSAAALDITRARLGARAADVTWLAADITRVELPVANFDLWHDRAVLHFLTAPADIDAYVANAAHAVRPGGHAVIGGFAGDGPTRCSGLDVVRRDVSDIAAVFVADFELRDGGSEVHTTPTDSTQHFAYALLRRR